MAVERSPAWLARMPGPVRRLVHAHPAMHAALGNLSWLFADKLVQLAVGLTVSIWIARYLGPEQFGLLSFGLAMVAIVGTLATLGIESIVVRDLVRNPRDTGRILGSSFLVQLVGGLVAWLVAIGLTVALRPDDRLVRLIVVILGFGLLFRATEVVAYLFEARVKSKYSVVAKDTAYLLVAASKVVLVFIQAPLLAFAWASLAGSVLTAVALWTVYRWSGERHGRFRPCLATSRQLFSQSWPLALSGLAVMIQARIDQVMLGSMIGDNEVAQYSVAMQLVEFLAFFPVILVSTLAPYVAKAKIVSESLYRDWLVNTYRLMFLLFLALAIPLFLLADRLVAFLYGPEYARAGVLLALLSIRLLLANFGIAKRLFVTNEDLFKYAMTTAVLGMVLNVALNYMLIPTFRSEGAIIASIASFLLTIFVADWFHGGARVNFRCMARAIATPHRMRFAHLWRSTSFT